MAFDDDVKISINLNKLVEARAKLLTQYEDYSKAVATGEYLDENDDRVLFVWGVGGNNKMNSISLILENYFNRQRKLLGI